MPEFQQSALESRSPNHVHRFGLFGFMLTITYYAFLFGFLRLIFSEDDNLPFRLVAIGLVGAGLVFPVGFLTGGAVRGVTWAIVTGLIVLNFPFLACLFDSV